MPWSPSSLRSTPHTASDRLTLTMDLQVPTARHSMIAEYEQVGHQSRLPNGQTSTAIRAIHKLRIISCLDQDQHLSMTRLPCQSISKTSFSSHNLSTTLFPAPVLHPRYRLALFVPSALPTFPPPTTARSFCLKSFMPPSSINLFLLNLFSRLPAQLLPSHLFLPYTR